MVNDAREGGALPQQLGPVEGFAPTRAAHLLVVVVAAAAAAAAAPALVFLVLLVVAIPLVLRIVV